MLRHFGPLRTPTPLFDRNWTVLYILFVKVCSSEEFGWFRCKKRLIGMLNAVKFEN